MEPPLQRTMCRLMRGTTRAWAPKVVTIGENGLQDSFGIDGNDRYRFTNSEREFSDQAPAVVTGIPREDSTRAVKGDGPQIPSSTFEQERRIGVNVEARTVDGTHPLNSG